MRKTRRSLLGVFGVAAFLTVTQASAGGGGQPTLRDIPCPESVSADRCGYARVPLDHRKPDGKTIEVFFAVKSALSTLKESTPMFFMPGGPGQSTGELMNYLASTAFPEFDLVGVDYRGSALSRPALSCPDPSAAGVARCAAQWTVPKSDLGFFNSWQAAQDVEVVRRALGYPVINLYGVSYGTYWAQQYASTHPQKLRSLILSGVLPTQVSGLKNLIPALDELIRQILQACSAQSACQQQHPDLLSRFEKQWPSLTPLQRNSLRAYVSLLGGTGVDLTRIPSLVDGLINGTDVDSSTLTASGPTGIDWGLNSIVNCLEQLPASPLTQEEASSRLLGVMSLEERAGLCKHLKLQPVPHTATLPPNLPTLLITGKWDARTPTVFLRSFDPLPQAWQKVIVSNAAHDLGWRTCPLSIMGQFAKHPTQRVDATCAAEGELTFR